MKVYVAENDDYNSVIWVIATSAEGARKAVIDEFPDPYIVKWSALGGPDGEDWSFSGQFEFVPGYSIKHQMRFVVTEHEVVQG